MDVIVDSVIDADNDNDYDDDDEEEGVGVVGVGLVVVGLGVGVAVGPDHRIVDNSDNNPVMLSTDFFKMKVVP